MHLRQSAVPGWLWSLSLLVAMVAACTPAPEAGGNAGQTPAASERMLVPLHRIPGHEALPNAAVFSPDGGRLATGDDQGLVHVWRVSDGVLIDSIEHLAGASSLSFSPDGERLAVGLTDGDVSVFDLQENRVVLALNGLTAGRVHALAFDPRRDWLAAASQDGNLYLWDLGSGTLEQILTSQVEDELHAVSYSRDGRFLATMTQVENVWIWEGTPSEPRLRLAAGDRLTDIEFSPDGSLLAIAEALSRDVALWDLESASRVGQLDDAVDLTDMVFTTDGEGLIGVGQDSRILYWDLEQPRPIWVLQGRREPTTTATLAGDASVVASTTIDGVVRIWAIR